MRCGGCFLGGWDGEEQKNLVEAKDEDVDQLWDRVRFWILTGSYAKKE